jgi:hypothetical protein
MTGQVVLVGLAICWLPPLLDWMGMLLMRFRVTRYPAVVVHALAGCLFLLGTVLCFYLAMESDWRDDSAVFNGALLLLCSVPLVIYAVQVCRRLRASRVARYVARKKSGS